MRKTAIRLALLLAAGALTTAFLPGIALGASAETTPVVAGALDVQLWPGAAAGQGVVIIAVTVPQDAKLPARVNIPVPTGAIVDWAGEIGSDATGDIERPRTVERGEFGSYAVFDLVSSHEAQLELSGLPLTQNGDSYSIKLDYVQTVPAGQTGFSVRLPAGAAEVTISPTPASGPDKNGVGESLYTLPAAQLKEGDARTITATYRISAGGGGAGTGAPTSSSSTSTLIAVLAGIALVLLVVLAVVIKMERAKRR